MFGLKQLRKFKVYLILVVLTLKSWFNGDLYYLKTGQDQDCLHGHIGARLNQKLIDRSCFTVSKGANILQGNLIKNKKKKAWVALMSQPYRDEVD